ncbi:response regulator transcription factor [Amycolatopsis pigmentata]|uniref:Response regulator transcription factor n=1 Tax=Amycolatopsis pigmentata TaxID=450801 RepID=A0ABW5FU22_9PSEU
MTHSNETGQAPPPAVTSRNLGIAVVDSVPIYREGLSAIIQRAPGMHWAGQAPSPHSALQMAEQVRLDVVLVDSGLDPHGHLIKLLLGSDPSLLVILLLRDAHRTPGFLSGARSAGVHGVVPRSVETRRLVEAIRRVQFDRRYVDPTLVPLVTASRSGTRSLDGGAKPKRPRLPLSRREYQVLQLVAEGLENAAIAKILFLSVETVRTHVKSILRKLSARDRTHAVTIAFRGGILVTQPDDSLERPPTSAPPLGLADHRMR